MDEKTMKQLKRSINHEHIYWQHLLLQHNLQADKFTPFEFEFAENVLDYRVLYKRLSAIELETKIDKMMHL